MQRCCRRLRFTLLSLLVLVLVLTACSQPAHATPGPTPTWGSFNPTVVPFPSATVVASPTAPAVVTPQPAGEG